MAMATPYRFHFLIHGQVTEGRHGLGALWLPGLRLLLALVLRLGVLVGVFTGHRLIVQRFPPALDAVVVAEYELLLGEAKPPETGVTRIGIGLLTGGGGQSGFVGTQRTPYGTAHGKADYGRGIGNGLGTLRRGDAVVSGWRGCGWVQGLLPGWLGFRTRWFSQWSGVEAVAALLLLLHQFQLLAGSARGLGLANSSGAAGRLNATRFRWCPLSGRRISRALGGGDKGQWRWRWQC